MEKLILTVGDKVSNVPEKFSSIEMFIHDGDSLNYYGTLNTIYNFDYVSFIDIPGDPRYYLEERENEIGNKIRCELKPLGEDRGLYQVIHGHRHLVAKFETTLDKKTLNY